MVRIYGDFNKWDRIGDDTFLILTTRGTFDDLQKLNVELSEGLHVILYMDDADKNGAYDELEADAEIRWSQHYKSWIGVYDPKKIRHASDRLNANPGSGGSL